MHAVYDVNLTCLHCMVRFSKHGARCVDGIGSYSCVCPANTGYQGKYCEGEFKVVVGVYMFRQIARTESQYHGFWEESMNIVLGNANYRPNRELLTKKGSTSLGGDFLLALQNNGIEREVGPHLLQRL